MSQAFAAPAPTYTRVSNLNRKRKFFPRQIGFRGRHDHGRAPDDPVYPTKSVPYTLRPRHPNDWRGPGRTLLCTGMALMEDSQNRLRSPGQVFAWQEKGYCHERCAGQCAKSEDRILCTWRVPGTQWELLNKLDGVLGMYKGVVETGKPIFSVHRRVAMRNRWNGLEYIVGGERYYCLKASD